VWARCASYRIEEDRKLADLESVWEHREETVYRALFGSVGDGIAVLTADMFGDLGAASVDPRWLSIGVIAFAPSGPRSSWIYVSSGLSNPWDTDPGDWASSEYSGLGVEFVLETPQQGDWAQALLLEIVAYAMLVAAGFFGERPHMSYGHRMAMAEPIGPDGNSELTSVVLVEPDHYASRFKLESGAVDLLHVLGITAAELQFAKETSSAELVGRLRSAGVYPRTDPRRRSIL
jgi:hypothetical protein